MAALERLNLTDWQWRLANANGQAEAEKLSPLGWKDVTKFPSVIQQELLAHDFIPNYHVGDNERHILWVGACDWEYRTHFKTPASSSSHVELVFEGLDTIATATLNGKEILRSDNMFIPARVDVKSHLKSPGQDNELILHFGSAIKAGKELEDKYGKRKSMMRDAKRNYLRKAQYHWGWDWGPIVVTAGPWKPVYLETYNGKIESIYIRTQKLDDAHQSAEVSIDIETVHAATNSRVRIVITDANDMKVSTHILQLADQKASLHCLINTPKLWWPNHQGSPHLYSASVELLAPSSQVLHSRTQRFGIRTIELIQRPLKDAPGKTFMFRVNGRDIFIQGGNWVPADNILTSISRARYFDWVKLAADGNLNMIRVWGGGVYESEDFFDACDEIGILVWHDFAFACNDLPTFPGFLDNVRKEAECQTRRLRSRASLALLAGGNEDFMLADWDKVKYDHSDTTGPFLDTPFPQREIYLKILPSVVEDLAPSVEYWPSSPWGGSSANDTTVGDIHQWRVWHLEQAPYQDYKKLSGRFVSEFGMHGFPVERTVNDFLRGAPESERHPQSKTIDCHNKGHGAHTRIARYLAENFRFDMANLSNFIYASHLLQSEAYGYALRDWKRLFSGPGNELCAGAIIWQLNDVYPSTSWAYVDYFLRPRPAYYTIKRAFAPFSIAAERMPSTRWIDEDRPRASEIPSFDIFAHNTTSSAQEFTLELAAFDFATGVYTDLGSQASRKVTLEAGRNTELGTLRQQATWTQTSLIILDLALRDSHGTLLARHTSWPEPFRYLTWPRDTRLCIAVGSGTRGWENDVTLSSNQALKGVWLEPVYDGTEEDGGREPVWEDNMLDLMPGVGMVVGVNGLVGREVRGRFLGDWEVGREGAKL
ncbi:glycoside hydrolase [Pyrenochaeta sp. DS3sAY3a]|nr:glycoside hydrolase [Pyrenochaeta sp. DS3sAY3a]